MEAYYILIVGVLFLLAISDLIVGVSNDAVNFLNSAIGSKAAPFKIILAIAAAGVLVGACCWTFLIPSACPPPPRSPLFLSCWDQLWLSPFTK